MNPPSINLSQELSQARFLIIDDEPANIRLLERHLTKWGYTQIQSTTDSRQALSLFEQFKPDLVLLDLMMPFMTGYEVMEQLQPLIPEGDFLPFVILSADITAPAKQRALAIGAKDFLNKPFDGTELSLRLRNLLETRFLYRQQRNQAAILEETVRVRTLALDESQIEILERLAQAAEFRDDDTGQHTRRVGQLSSFLAHILGQGDKFIDLIRRTAPLHDVGKIAIPDAILLKPGRLTPEEFEVMKTHTTIGAELLAGGKSELVCLAQSIALTHHERFDGNGYPQKLKGEEIPIEGRIVAIVDVFDALTHERPYKAPWPIEDAVAEISKHSGTQFDPAVVEAFLRVPNLSDFV